MTYVVRPGDTLFSIAGRFGITLQALLAANPNVQPGFVYVGQVLTIPTGGPGPFPPFPPVPPVPPTGNVEQRLTRLEREIRELERTNREQDRQLRQLDNRVDQLERRVRRLEER